MPFLVCQKMKTLAHFVKNQYFRHDSQFSSFPQFFVKSEILCSLCIMFEMCCSQVVQASGRVSVRHAVM